MQGIIADKRATTKKGQDEQVVLKELRPHRIRIDVGALRVSDVTRRRSGEINVSAARSRNGRSIMSGEAYSVDCQLSIFRQPIIIASREAITN